LTLFQSPQILHYSIGFFLVFFATYFATDFFRIIALRLQILDQPLEAHKYQNAPIPYLGGGAIMSIIMITCLIGLLNEDFNTKFTVFLILLPSIVMGLVGLIDDILVLSARLKFFLQNTIAIPTSLLLIASESSSRVSGSKLWNFLITAVFYLLVMNSVNLFDNIDGGVASLMITISFFGGILSVLTTQYALATLFVLIAGSSSGFLIWNWPPAKIYLGDCGSLFLGSMLATIFLRLDFPQSPSPDSALLVLLILAVLLLDTSVVIVSRIGRSISPFKAGKDHLSHRLMFLGCNKISTVLSLNLLNCVFGMLALQIYFSSGLAKAILTISSCSLWILLFCLFLWIPFQERDVCRDPKN
jgi:UDP-GlcNAc:undecaprenyl-phosphate GlcNAc-1-phosphate transferase